MKNLTKARLLFYKKFHIKLKNSIGRQKAVGIKKLSSILKILGRASKIATNKAHKKPKK